MANEIVRNERKTRIGVVVSNKMDKTIVVLVKNKLDIAIKKRINRINGTPLNSK